MRVSLQDRVAKGQSRHLRHLIIRDDEVVHLRIEMVERLGRGQKCRDDVSTMGKHPPGDLAHPFVVINVEDFK